MRARWVAVIAAVCALAPIRPATAQVPAQSMLPDTTRGDTLRKRADTITTTDRLLAAQKEERVRRQVMPLPGVGPIEPAGTRYVFTRDSIDWATAEDLGELLSRIPGVFLERTDWIASANMPNYFGLGASAVEYRIDGVPWLPIGIDSVASDPSTLSLELFDRVEVERAPGMLRVDLFTREHDRAAPRTKIGVAQGDRGVARYFGDFESRYASGIGLGLAADYVGVNPVSSGNGGANIPSGWIQFGYVPNFHFGVQAQYTTEVITRNLLLGSGSSPDTLAPQMDGTRADEQLRMSWRQRPDGLGPSVDVFAAQTKWSSDSTPQSESIGEFGAVGAVRHPSWSAQLAAWHYTRWTDLDSRLDLGWTPLRGAAASVQVVSQRYDHDRIGQWVTGRVGLALPFGFRIGGDVSEGHRVQAPSIATDSVRHFLDAETTAGFDSRLLTLDAGVLTESAWRPESFPEYAAIDSFAPLPRTQWVTAHARFAPTSFLTLESVYQHPLNGVLPGGSPPKHALTTVTLRSWFLRNFPHGIFQLKLQVAAESWSHGIGGLDSLGQGIVLPGATFFRGLIQLQLGPFIAYYDRENLTAVRTGYVPGYPVQPVGATYGVRWEFSN